VFKPYLALTLLLLRGSARPQLRSARPVPMHRFDLPAGPERPRHLDLLAGCRRDRGGPAHWAWAPQAKILNIKVLRDIAATPAQALLPAGNSGYAPSIVGLLPRWEGGPLLLGAGRNGGGCDPRRARTSSSMSRSGGFVPAQRAPRDAASCERVQTASAISATQAWALS